MASSPKLPRGTNTVFSAMRDALEGIPQKSRSEVVKAVIPLLVTHLLDNGATWVAGNQPRKAAAAKATKITKPASADAPKKRGRKPGSKNKIRVTRGAMNGHAQPEAEQDQAAA